MSFAELSPPYGTIVADPPWPYDDKPTGYQRTSGRRSFLPYSTLTLEEIEALEVGRLAAPAAHLFCWTTQRYLWDARDVIAAWGWGDNPLVLTWCKPPMGMGGGNPAFCSTTEFLLYARKPVGALILAARESLGLTRRQVHTAVRGGEPTGIVYRWEADDCYPTRTDWAELRRLLPALHGLPDLAAEPLFRYDTTWWQWSRSSSHSAKPAAAMDVIEIVAPARVELFARQPRLGWDSWGYGYEGVA